jgi:hypothetical protein
VANPKVAGDPQLHTHVTTPNVVVCDGGSVGGMDMLALHDRVHEVGAYYQAHLATNLRAFGIEVVLDERTETAKMTAVPDAFCEVFELRSFLRPQSRHNQHVPADYRRLRLLSAEPPQCWPSLKRPTRDLRSSGVPGCLLARELR